MKQGVIKVKSEISELFKFKNGVKLSIPLFADQIHAGFPSPADDYIEQAIDLNRDFIKNPDSTFYGRVSSDSMEPLIHIGAMLIIDRAAETVNHDIVLAHINGEFCMKRLYLSSNGGGIKLLSENETYPPIVITGEMNFCVWGKVIHAIQSF